MSNIIDSVEIFWVLLFAITAELLSIRMKIPSVVGMLGAGLLLGPFVLGLVHEDSIENLAELGAILLLFSIGIQFSIEKLINSGIKTILTGILKMAIAFILLQNAVVFLGIDFRTAFIIAAMFSITSTAILIRILQQKGMFNRVEVNTLMAMLVLEDITAIFILTIVSGMGEGRDLNFQSVAINLLLALFALGFSYIILKKLLVKASSMILKYGTDGTLVFASIFIALLFSGLAAYLGLSSAIGAFLAGSMVVALPEARRFEHAIKPFDVTLSSLFFISIGMLINPISMLELGLIAPLIIVLAMFFVFTATSISVYMVGIPRNGISAAFAGSAMALFGEFSLLIAKEGAPISSVDTIGIASFAVLVSAVANPFLVERNERIRLLVRQTVPKIVIDIVDSLSIYIEMIVLELRKAEKIAQFMNYRIRKTRSPLEQETLILVGYAVLFFVIIKTSQDDLLRMGMLAALTLVTLALSTKPLMAIACATTGICVSLNQAWKQLLNFLMHDTTIKNLIAASILLSSTVIIQPVLEVFCLGKLSRYLEIPMLILGVMFVWRAAVNIHKELHAHRHRIR